MAREYPRWMHHLTKKEVVVKDPDAEAALGVGWTDTPSAFEPYRGPRPARRDPQGCLQWVNEWPVPNLSSNHRTRIKAELLKADAAFCKSPDDPATVEDCMRRAFAGVAEVLFEAGILSEQLLENEIPEFVWDTAVAGGWWRFASATHPGISSEQIGHYWVWWHETRDWPALFRGVRAEWLARLLQAQSQTARTGPHVADLQPRLDQGPVLDTDRINQWIWKEGYNNQELADKLHISQRAVSSMRNNRRYHGRDAVEKLAKLMELDTTDLYLPVK